MNEEFDYRIPSQKEWTTTQKVSWSLAWVAGVIFYERIGLTLTTYTARHFPQIEPSLAFAIQQTISIPSAAVLGFILYRLIVAKFRDFNSAR